jgi:class 3 adenylate cyclase
MERLSAYLPRDRFVSLAHGSGSLPDRALGTALYADISGFTPMAEALARELGPLRGAEELTRQPNQVYAAVIAEVDRYRGSVTSFAGDAITCWFEDDAGQRAAASALAMEAAMTHFASPAACTGGSMDLSIRIGIALGHVRRFVVGDPAIQRIDVMAGATVERMATAQHVAGKREVLIDEACAVALGGLAQITEWRLDVPTGQRFAVLSGLNAPVAPRPWLEQATAAVPQTQLCQWLLAPVYTRLMSEAGDFLTELWIPSRATCSK